MIAKWRPAPAAALNLQEAGVSSALLEEPLFSRVIHLRTLYLGPEELLGAAKIAVDPSASLAAVAKQVDEAEARVREALLVAKVIYLEPDVDRAPARDSD